MRKRNWPDWLEGLRPDDVTSARLRREIARAARPLLDARRDEWWDVASRWATVLVPIAAVLTLVFAGLVLRQDAGDSTLAFDQPAAGVIDPVPWETVPAGFSEADAASADVEIVFAAMGEAHRRRPWGGADGSAGDR